MNKLALLGLLSLVSLSSISAELPGSWKCSESDGTEAMEFEISNDLQSIKLTISGESGLSAMKLLPIVEGEIGTDEKAVVRARKLLGLQRISIDVRQEVLLVAVRGDTLLISEDHDPTDLSGEILGFHPMLICDRKTNLSLNSLSEDQRKAE